MEVTSLIRLGLWIPFAFMLLISGLIFALRGWKKGLPRTVLYLISTVLAAIVALLMSRLVSKFASPPLVDLIMKEMTIPEGMGSGLAISLIEGMIRAVVSMLLFPFFLFLFNILIRLIATHIRIPFLDLPKYKMPGVALAVGLFTAVLYSILMMLPLYGTIGAYVPTIRSVLEMTGEEVDEETNKILRELGDHAMVKVAYSGPAAALYDELTALPLGEASIKLPDVTRSMKRLAESFKELEECEPGDEESELLDFAYTFRREVVRQPWCYDVCMGVVTELRKEVEQEIEMDYMTDEEVEFLEDMLDTLECPEDVFVENLDAFTDLTILMLEEDGIELIDNGDISELRKTGILEETGRLFNSNDEGVALKKMLMTVILSDAVGGDFETAMEILEEADIEELDDERDQLKEAEAILLGLSSPEELILRHPDLGQAFLEYLYD